ncbi:MAG: hypothetical protein NZ610_08120 [Candidatus Bipolaricaulota bacterium]|nr:hypothetical protein [Candidatus Bipolaricaulota bacterium]MCS7275342.1 hypothetical protein [Candidatus Bipolaricaulota bacterium]MDW8110159.1 hypothetical protein [Candidatus Bipolaricaulota bacterium]MDW8329191.1 hypothetical protein [Candidatus Bipolaricaulota bacterium]
MRILMMIVVGILLLAIAPNTYAQPKEQSVPQSKLELRYDWLWGWQFKKDGKWRNVGLFASELRRAVSDVEEAVEVINEINLISAGLYLAAAAGGVLTTLSVRCERDRSGKEDCEYGPGYLLGVLLSGAGHFGKQMIQGIYFDRAIRIYNKAKGLE